MNVNVDVDAKDNLHINVKDNVNLSSKLDFLIHFNSILQAAYTVGVHYAYLPSIVTGK